MFQTKVVARRLAFKLAAGLSTVALAAGVTALGASAAQAASRAAPGLLFAPAPIAVNPANWSGSAGFGSTAPSWYVDGSGVVHLQGAARQVSSTGTGQNLLGTLPPPARPVRNVFVIVHTLNGTYADLEVAASGQMKLTNCRERGVALSRHVRYRPVRHRPGRVRHLPKRFPRKRTARLTCGRAGR